MFKKLSSGTSSFVSSMTGTSSTGTSSGTNATEAGAGVVVGVVFVANCGVGCFGVVTFLGCSFTTGVSFTSTCIGSGVSGISGKTGIDSIMFSIMGGVMVFNVFDICWRMTTDTAPGGGGGGASGALIVKLVIVSVFDTLSVSVTIIVQSM